MKRIDSLILKRWLQCLGCCLIVLGAVFPTVTIRAQSAVVKITEDSIKSNNKTEFNLTKKEWAFHSGDDLRWKSATLNDQLWKQVNPSFGAGNPLKEWDRIGWFRLWVSIDSSIKGRTLALRINHDGASEIFIDGVYKGGFGKIGTKGENIRKARPAFDLIPFQLEDTKPHLIAIRYSNLEPIFPDFEGFQLWGGDYIKMNADAKNSIRLFSYMYFGVAAQLALAILHLILFLFYPQQRINLWYFLFSVFFAGTSWAVSMFSMASTPMLQYTANQVFFLCCILGTSAAWVLLYKAGNTSIPKWKACVVCALTLVYSLKYLLIPLSKIQDGFAIVFLILMLDGIWQLISAIKKQQPYTWIVGLGMLIVVLLYFFVGADLFHLWKNYPLRCLTMSIGLLSFPLCYSVYVALDFSRTNRDLSIRLLEVEQLSEKTIAQEKDKLEILTQQADKLEKTVAERTKEVQQQADKLREMDVVKSRFFVNLTHEFRTPLTLIQGPANQILTTTKDETINAYAETINRNAEKLLELINQLLDLSKLEAGKMELDNTETELIALVRRNFLSFESLATQKGIKLRFKSDETQLCILIDQAKLERILYNLLSNAIKFTGEAGNISLKVLTQKDSGNNHFKIIVSDNGIGIPKEKLLYIFERFYQVDASDTRAQEGTGIGLAITKELMSLMGGEIEISSKEKYGTNVTLSLPLKILEAPDGSNAQRIRPEQSRYEGRVIKKEATAIRKNQQQVLIIEDNQDMSAYLKGLIEPFYDVTIAVNGAQGLEMALLDIPDLIITDLMMPVMDGYEVCDTLKNDSKTSHIPVIILTAKANAESRIAGFEKQADAYLAKPFDQKELLVIIENLMKLRTELRKKFGKGNVWLRDSAELPSMEQVFLDKVRELIESNLDDEQYSVEKLGSDISLSRTQLHRKLTALLNQSPGDLIRIIRMERAFELLKKRVGTVAEVSYMVGYGNPKNFSTTFSKHFGFTPNEATNY